MSKEKYYSLGGHFYAKLSLSIILVLRQTGDKKVLKRIGYLRCENGVFKVSSTVDETVTDEVYIYIYILIDRYIDIDLDV